MLILNSPNCDQHNVHDLQVKIYPQSKPHKNIPKTKKRTWVKLLDQKRLWCQVRKCHKDREMNCWPSQAADYLWSKRRQASPDGSRGPLEGEQRGERGENGRDSGLKCSTSSPHYPSSQKYGETNSRRKKIEQLYFNLRISKGIKFVFSPFSYLVFVRDKMFDNVIMKAVTRRRRQSLLTSHLSSIYLFTCLELRSLEFFFKNILKFLERKGIGNFLQQFMGRGGGGQGLFWKFPQIHPSIYRP